jgi:hypothetical protein
MVGTIGLAGSKAREQGRLMNWTLRIGAPHLAASAVSGAAVGFVASLAGAALLVSAEDLPLSPSGLLLAPFAVADALGIPAKVASRSKQVPMSWKQVFPAPMSATLYGVVLGAGVFSTVYFWSFWALIVALVLTADVATGLLGGLAYGLARAAPTMASVATPGEASVLHASEFLHTHVRVVRLISAASILAAGLAIGSR